MCNMNGLTFKGRGQEVSDNLIIFPTNFENFLVQKFEHIKKSVSHVLNHLLDENRDHACQFQGYGEKF
jgi:hypothetical protein